MAIKDYKSGAANDAMFSPVPPNDHYSIFAAARAAELAAEKAKQKAADEAAAAAKRKAEQDARDLETTRTDKANLESRVRTLLSEAGSSDTRLGEIQAELATLKQDLKQAQASRDAALQTAQEERQLREQSEKQVNDAGMAFNKARGECDKLKADKDDALNELCQLKQPLDCKNNLDPSCHDRIVTFGLLRPPFTALDFGGSITHPPPGPPASHLTLLLFYRHVVANTGSLVADSGRKPHGWVIDANNGSQKLRLLKTNPSDRHSPWTIDCGGRYLGLSGGSNYDAANLKNRQVGSDGRAQEWYIGRLEKGWMIHNVRYDMALDMADGWANYNGKALRAFKRDASSPCQVFLIIIR
ncbi:hypothetical protein QQS21_008523 [Conoideocrella luteorostrata]|uniref:Ricin B lectin domain-containing protein n=1 Tax=Conoideocrella luteorostrata TaxID=1105319 RepID=A0AAJ0CJK7_9HYPO|nr:hypothetical protein QQS21_008523 [Conoideocrella luteorostrata]